MARSYSICHSCGKKGGTLKIEKKQERSEIGGENHGRVD